MKSTVLIDMFDIDVNWSDSENSSLEAFLEVLREITNLFRKLR